MNPLFSLLYTSRARPGLGDSDVASILASANRHNTEADITGALLLYAERFMQVIEGPLPSVEACFERIGRDPRHDEVRVLAKAEIAARRFGRWSMRHVRVAQGADRAVSAFFAELVETPTPERVELATALLRRLAGN